MFGWAKRSRIHNDPQAASKAAPLIVALLMAGESFPLSEFQEQLSRAAIGGNSPKSIDSQKGILLFNLRDELVAIAPMPAPYPWSDVKGPCATSWMWPRETPASTLQRHRSHVLITMMQGKSSRIERRLMLTYVTAMAAQQRGVLGVYWPEATLVHFPPVFVGMAETIKSPHAPPLYLWVDFRVFKNADGSSGMFTTGLRGLGQMEVEIPKIQMSPRELREWSINIAYYLLENGPKVKDGDTMGVTAEQQIRIRHRPSLYGKQEPVMRFEA